MADDVAATGAGDLRCENVCRADNSHIRVAQSHGDVLVAASMSCRAAQTKHTGLCATVATQIPPETMPERKDENSTSQRP